MGQRQGLGRAAHVLFHQKHAARRFDVEPAAVETDAFTDQGHPRRLRLAPGDVDQARAVIGRPPDGVDRRIAFFQQILAGDHRAFGFVPAGEVAGGGGQFARPQVAGRGVDQIAGQRDALGLGGDQRAVAAAWPHQFGMGFGFGLVIGFITIEAIAAEQPAQRRRAGRRRRWRAGQAVAAGRQLRRQVGEIPKPRFGALHADQNLFRRAIGAGHRQMRAAGGGEGVAGQPGARRRRRRRAPRRQTVGVERGQGHGAFIGAVNQCGNHRRLQRYVVRDRDHSPAHVGGREQLRGG